MAKVNGFTVWDDEYDAQHFSAEEIAASDLEAELIMAFFGGEHQQLRH